MNKRYLSFIQESKDEDCRFRSHSAAATGSRENLQDQGSLRGDGALRDSGNGNFILIPRSTWYPNNAAPSLAIARSLT